MKQIAKEIKLPNLPVAAGGVPVNDAQWIATQWNMARMRQKTFGTPLLLIIDEVQKINQLSEYVKAE